MDEKETSNKILDFISHNPGLHVSKIAELLGMKIAEVENYLQSLEKQGLLNVTRESGYQRYYSIAGRAKIRDKRTQEISKEIYTMIAQNPGLHLSKIAELLHMSIPLTDYHLLQLEKDKEIFALKDEKGYYKRYYIAAGGIEVKEKKILEELKKKIPLQIVLFLVKQPVLQHRDLLERLSISSSTLSYHLTKLVASDILDVRTHGEEKGYTLKDREEIIRILKKYEFHIELQVALDNFKDMWGDLSYHDSLG